MAETTSAAGRAGIAAIAAMPALVLLLPILAVAAVLLLFVSLVRWVGRLLEPRFLAWPELVEFDRVLGWKPRRNLDTHYLAELDDVFRIVTDDEGWPGRRSIEDSDVVVVGDSFVFGYGVDTKDSFAEVKPSLKVKAIGAPWLQHGARSALDGPAGTTGPREVAGLVRVSRE
jgi:hypothetical protein